MAPGLCQSSGNKNHCSAVFPERVLAAKQSRADSLISQLWMEKTQKVPKQNGLHSDKKRQQSRGRCFGHHEHQQQQHQQLLLTDVQVLFSTPQAPQSEQSKLLIATMHTERVTIPVEIPETGKGKGIAVNRRLLWACGVSLAAGLLRVWSWGSCAEQRAAHTALGFRCASGNLPLGA